MKNSVSKPKLVSYLNFPKKANFSAQTVYEAAKTAINEGLEDVEKMYILFDVFSKAFDLLKKDSEVKQSVETAFLRHGVKGKDVQFAGFKIKVYDKMTKEEFTDVDDDIVEDYKIMVSDIAIMTQKKKECEEWMRQNCDVPKKYCTVVSISSKRD